MKIKFTNFDIMASIRNLVKYINYRLINIYEVNSKVFILKLTNKKEKVFIKLISGFRFHTINDKPNNCKQMPNTFTQKMRKHMNNKRLISITQLGLDRTVDFQFGEGEFAYHIILEIYSIGNVILTDNKYKIISLQRRYIKDDLNISVNQIYNKSLYENLDFLDEEKVKDWLDRNPEDLLDKESPFKCLGPSFLKNYNVTQIENIINDYKNLDIGKGYLMKNKYTSLVWEKDNEAEEYEDFDLMVREFYKDEDKVEVKKVKKKGKKNGNKFDRAKKEYEKRVTNLGKKMANNEDKATWIYENADEIDRIIEKVNSMNRNYVEEYIEKMESSLQPIKYNCKHHKLIINKVEIFCDKSAYANGNTYFNNKKKIKVKYDKTIESGGNAINKLKKKEFENKKKKDLELKYEYEEKNFWFQQYNWYIIDNRFLIISGKNADQNEEIVKKYMDKEDKYIHGNFFGSPSMIIKDMRGKEEISLQVLLRGGDFLVCMSNNWKVSRSENTYYVNPEQVSKTAPSGEYVTKGSFMIRGNKNYLPNANLELGIGILFIDGKGDEIEYISKPNKILKSCIPVIGPYRDMKNKYKYCVKVKPGNQKQGKVINAIITKFMKLKEGNENEKFLIKKIKKDLWCKIVRSNVHLIL